MFHAAAAATKIIVSTPIVVASPLVMTTREQGRQGQHDDSGNGLPERLAPHWARTGWRPNIPVGRTVRTITRAR